MGGVITVFMRRAGVSFGLLAVLVVGSLGAVPDVLDSRPGVDRSADRLWAQIQEPGRNRAVRPTKDELEVALADVRGVLGSRLGFMTADDLVKLAADTTDDPRGRYALLELAQHAAARANDATAWAEATASIVESYESDARALLLEDAAAMPRDFAVGRQLLLGVVWRAAADGDASFAESLTAALEAGGAPTGQREAWATLIDDVKWISRLARSRQAGTTTRPSQADEASWQWFTRANWSHRPPAAVGDGLDRVQQAVEQGVASPVIAADALWDFAGTQTGLRRDATIEQAVELYQRGIYSLTGLTRERVQARIRQGTESVSRSPILAIRPRFDLPPRVEEGSRQNEDRAVDGNVPTTRPTTSPAPARAVRPSELLLLDSTGSMLARYPAAQRLSINWVTSMIPGTRFNVILVREQPRELYSSLTSKSPNAQRAAMTMIGASTAAGGGGLSPSLKAAIADRPDRILLITDGDIPDLDEVETTLRRAGGGRPFKLEIVVLSEPDDPVGQRLEQRLAGLRRAGVLTLRYVRPTDP